MRKRRKKYLVVIVVIIVLVLVGGYCVYSYLLNGDNKLKNEIKNVEGIEKEDDNDEVEATEEEQKQEQEEVKEYNFDTQSGEEVKVEANKVVSATGFSGASNYKFYLRGTTLYFKNVSVSETEEEVLAYNVKDLYLENKEVVAELYSDGKIVKENNYITYK